MRRRRIGVSPSEIRRSAADAVDRYRQVLDRRASRTLLLSAICSNIGDWLSFVALMAMAVDLGDGALGVGGMLALRLVPTILFQVFAGTVVDRMQGKRLLVLSQLIMAILAWSFLLLQEFQSLWLLYLLVVLLEIANAFARPAFMVQLVNSVEPDHRGAVNGLFAMSVTIAQFAGALAGAVVLRVTGESPLFIINGLTFLVIAIAVARLGPSEGERAAAEESEAPAEQTEPGLAGYTRLLRMPDVFGFALVTLAVSIMTQAAISLFEVRARALDLGKGGGGAFFAALAVGFLIGGAAAGAGKYRSITTLYLIATAEIVGALGVITFGLVDSLPLVFVALFACGLSAELSEIPAFTYFQNRLPPEIYGRFFSLFLFTFAAGGLIGALGGPLLEQRLSESATLVIVATPALIMAVKLALVAWDEKSKGADSLRVEPRDQYSSADLS